MWVSELEMKISVRCGAARNYAWISTSKRLLEGNDDDWQRKGSRVLSRVSRHNRRSLEVSSAFSTLSLRKLQQTNYKSRFAVFSCCNNFDSAGFNFRKKMEERKERAARLTRVSRVWDHIIQYAHTEALLIRQSSLIVVAVLYRVRRESEKQWKNVYTKALSYERYRNVESVTRCYSFFVTDHSDNCCITFSPLLI